METADRLLREWMATYRQMYVEITFKGDGINDAVFIALPKDAFDCLERIAKEADDARVP